MPRPDEWRAYGDGGEYDDRTPRGRMPTRRSSRVDSRQSQRHAEAVETAYVPQARSAPPLVRPPNKMAVLVDETLEFLNSAQESAAAHPGHNLKQLSYLSIVRMHMVKGFVDKLSGRQKEDFGREPIGSPIGGEATTVIKHLKEIWGNAHAVVRIKNAPKEFENAYDTLDIDTKAMSDIVASVERSGFINSLGVSEDVSKAPAPVDEDWDHFDKTKRKKKYYKSKNLQAANPDLIEVASEAESQSDEDEERATRSGSESVYSVPPFPQATLRVRDSGLTQAYEDHNRRREEERAADAGRPRDNFAPPPVNRDRPRRRERARRDSIPLRQPITYESHDDRRQDYDYQEPRRATVTIRGSSQAQRSNYARDGYDHDDGYPRRAEPPQFTREYTHSPSPPRAARPTRSSTYTSTPRMPNTRESERLD